MMNTNGAIQISATTTSAIHRPTRTGSDAALGAVELGIGLRGGGHRAASSCLCVQRR